MAKSGKEALEELGLLERPAEELPQEIQVAKAELSKRPKGKVGVELKRLGEEHVYVYEDEDVRLEIPVPRVDIFDAFVNEWFGKFGPETKTLSDQIKVIAGAFWLLHQKPKFWNRKWKTPKIDNQKAYDLLVKAIPKTSVVLNSLPVALTGLVEYVVGKKKVNPASSAD